MSKQPIKSEILDNPAYRNKAAQLTLMQRIMLISEGSVGRADGVVQTEPVLTERKKEVEEPKKWTRLLMRPKLIQLSQKKRKVSFESKMVLVKLKEKTQNSTCRNLA